MRGLSIIFWDAESTNGRDDLIPNYSQSHHPVQWRDLGAHDGYPFLLSNLLYISFERLVSEKKNV